MSEVRYVDWRKILIAYMNEVSQAEGVDFLPSYPMNGDLLVDGLTREESCALLEASCEGNLREDVKVMRREIIKRMRKGNVIGRVPGQ